MVRRFFRDSAIYALPGAVSTGTAFITFPLFAHHFPPRAYGLLDLIGFASTLAVMIVALEIYQGVGRYVSGEQSFPTVQRYASTALWWAVACYACFAVLTLAFAAPISSVLLGRSAFAGLVRIGGAWTAVQGVLSVMQAQLRWQMRPKAFAGQAIVNAIVTASGALFFVFVAHQGIAGVLWGQLLGSAVALVLVAVLARDIFRPLFDRATLTRMLRYSTPLVISNVGVFLNLYADRFVIQHVRSVADVGVYGVGNRIALLVMLVLMGFQGAATPLFLSRRDDPSTPREIARIFRLFVALSLALVIALSIFASPMLRILAAAPYQSAVYVVPYLMVSTLFANMYMFAPGLVIAERTRTMAILTASAGVANLALAWALVPVLGITGAGIATAVTSMAWFAALMRASQRHYPVPHHWASLTQAFTAAIVVIGASVAFLSEARSAALNPGALVIRAVFVLGGVTVCTALCLGRDDLRKLIAVLDRAVRPRARRQQPA